MKKRLKIPVKDVTALCEQSVNCQRAKSTRRAVEKLLTDISPELHDQVTRLLTGAQADPTGLVGIWSKAGERDHTRSLNLDVGKAAKNTMTPLGLACLLAYARTWLDTHDQAQAQALRQASQRRD